MLFISELYSSHCHMGKNQRFIYVSPGKNK